MGDLVSLSRPCGYFVARASRHRCAGRYDEAMTLLTKAKGQFGCKEEIELEMACVYEAMGCEEEAARSYLRVVRLEGKKKAPAFFHLALLGLQHGDTQRALSYYQQFCSVKAEQSDIPEEMVVLLGRQLSESGHKQQSFSRKTRIRVLERQIIEKIHAGKSIAAKRTAERAVALNPTAQGYTLLACCSLLCNQPEQAVEAAQCALELKPMRIQTRCILIDALYTCNEHIKARSELYLSAMRARTEEDRLLVAIESAKYGEDQLTVRLTGDILKWNAFQTRAMMLRGCALMNLGRLREACRLFARLCVLLPESSVCEAYYRMARDGEMPEERLDLGMDVNRMEGMRRSSEVIKCLLEVRSGVLLERERQSEMCRLCAWAIDSSIAGAQTKMAALVLLKEMNTEYAKEILLDCLTDARMDDQFKMTVLRMLVPASGVDTYWMDYAGKLVRVAACSEERQS